MIRVLQRAIILPAVLISLAAAGREPVLKQVDLPHSYYWRELYLPQLTTGPSSASFTPSGTALVYSMAGSLWRQTIGSDDAVELTHPAGAYDYQPDVAPDGNSVVFSRYDGKAMELWRLDLRSGVERQLTSGGAVNVEPRLSHNGKRIAWVSTKGSGHFNILVADLGTGGLGDARLLVPARESRISRYYYSTWDHSLSPSWTADDRHILYVSNAEVAWGSGDIWSVSVDNPADRRKLFSEESSWGARPDLSPDNQQILFSSYHGRQWRQLWVTTRGGAAALPLTFGDFDRSNARWSPDGRRIALISNAHGNTSLVVHDYVGGAETPIAAVRRRYLTPQSRMTLDIRDEQGRPVSARVVVLASDGRAAAPSAAWMHADDGFDRAVQGIETHYFHCNARCTVEAPPGRTRVSVQRGFRYLPWQRTVALTAAKSEIVRVALVPNDLPKSFGTWRSADLHVHMNYGGHYRNTPANLAQQARSEDLEVVYNLIVNKEERVPDISYFRGDPDPASRDGVLLLHSQEYHTSYWGHLGLLGLSDHYLTPGYSAYQNSPLASAYPDNGLIADLAHSQDALVGYVHPFDTIPDPQKDNALTNQLPADVAHGKIDYLEIVGFSDHKSTADVWYRLLNLGFRIPAGAGTDAMANYASLRGPVGMNRVFLQMDAHDVTPAAVKAALKGGQTFASNGPLLGLELHGKGPGGVISLRAPGKLGYRIALRSPVAVDHLELVQDGTVLKTFALAGDRRRFDAAGELPAGSSGWVLLRAWNDQADPQVLDMYPYATTSPVYIELPGGLRRRGSDAAYFVAWLDRSIASAEIRKDYRNAAEREHILDYLRRAREHYARLSSAPR